MSPIRRLLVICKSHQGLILLGLCFFSAVSWIRFLRSSTSIAQYGFTDQFSATCRTKPWHKQSCMHLLTTGKLQGDTWNPKDCKMIRYDTTNTRRCYKIMSEKYGSAYISFLGDSRVRTLIRNLIRMANASSPLSEHVQNQTDIHYLDKEINLHLELKWTPVFNKDMFNALDEWYKRPAILRPLVIIAGAGLWQVNWEGVGDYNKGKFMDNIIKMRDKMVKIVDQSVLVWTMTDPVIYEKLTESRKNLTEENINWYNNMTKDTISGHGIKIWESARMVSFAYGVTDYTDGLHVSGETLDKDLQILMNYFCNPFMNQEQTICCSGSAI